MQKKAAHRKGIKEGGVLIRAVYSVHIDSRCYEMLFIFTNLKPQFSNKKPLVS